MVTAQPWPAGASSSASQRRERNPLGGCPVVFDSCRPAAWRLLVHLDPVLLIRFENRLLGSMQSVWRYFTCKRAAGLLVALPLPRRRADPAVQMADPSLAGIIAGEG